MSDPVPQRRRARQPDIRRLSTVDGGLRPGGVDRRPAGATLRLADPAPPARLRDRGPVPASSAAPALSRRERDVLALLADGYSTREIARRLCYSERTIKNILQDFTARLHLRNRTQAVAYALRRGWI